ncbi:3-hydroxybutyryl-CoA dehydrogenase [candidate division TA06 bacterium SM1_40]|uniref:3-hydroxyacyl-CoA dehydrogenase n=2 Tax=Bacteria division TA06 TaxID=1156500 RepID=A0A0S8JJN2_UNCT6|nr:MAG: 3-hydroxybutyryl-CoA dehydrogenase [candidate division TA06 bacterium SM23_40]KPL09880.1 MAG: 3-hydroxybutyryl-CoA dehydrogenase [candidate division TA06 bacterium SM1_40]
MAINRVGVVGCGLMGSGIAQVSAQSGYETVVREISDELLEKGLGKIKKVLARGVEKGKLKQEEMADTLVKITGTVELKDLGDCDIIIEAVTENVDVKKDLFKMLDGISPPHAIFASNTSSLKITDIAGATKRPEQFIGLHFFNPVPLMKLVEVVRTPATSDEAFEAGLGFVSSLGKTPVACKDTTGFVVNRLLIPYLLDGIRAVEAEVASVEDIDVAMKLGCGYPMGPLTLLDFIGLDTILYIAGIMHDEFKQPQYAPPRLLEKMVREGTIGKKAGKGFYDYTK